MDSNETNDAEEAVAPSSAEATATRRRFAKAVMGIVIVVACVWLLLPWLPIGGGEIPSLESPEEAKYSVPPGLYQQANAESGERLLSVDGDGQGRLIVKLPMVSAIVVGAGQVDIETVWQVEEDDVTFYLQGGNPEGAYRRLLTLALEEETKFHIKEWRADALTLERVTDGELFEWERIADEPLPQAEDNSSKPTAAGDGSR